MGSLTCEPARTLSMTINFGLIITVLHLQCPCSPASVLPLPLQVFTQVGGEEWSSLAAFHDCVGDINADQLNDMMEHEMDSQRGGGDVGEVRSSLLVAASVCTSYIGLHTLQICSVWAAHHTARMAQLGQNCIVHTHSLCGPEGVSKVT